MIKIHPTTTDQPGQLKMALNLTGKRRILFNLFAVFVILLCARLSLWQQHRAKEKQQLLDLRGKNAAHLFSEANIDYATPQKNYYKKVQLSGHFLVEKAVYVDNQMFKQRVGYDVLMPFQTKQNHIFWINRGWIPAALTRDSLPKIPEVEGEHTIQAMILVPNKAPFRLGDVQDKYLPNRFQVLDLKVLNDFFMSSLVNSVMILQKNNPGSLTYHYQAVVVPPARHQGYAVQWLGIALVWLIFTIYANKKFKA